MKISELIELLEDVIDVEGDIDVSVKYRDANGEYDGEEEPWVSDVREDEHYDRRVVMQVGNRHFLHHVEHCSGKRLVL